MWNGWRKAREAGITPERINELGHAWLANIGENRGKRATDRTLSDQAEQDLQKKNRSKDEKKRDRQVHSEGSVPKAEAKRVAEEVAPNLRPADAKKVVEAALDRLEPAALDDVARKIVPSVESDTLKTILSDLIAKLDEEELESRCPRGGVAPAAVHNQKKAEASSATRAPGNARSRALFLTAMSHSLRSTQ